MKKQKFKIYCCEKMLAIAKRIGRYFCWDKNILNKLHVSYDVRYKFVKFLKIHNIQRYLKIELTYLKQKAGIIDLMDSYGDIDILYASLLRYNNAYIAHHYNSEGKLLIAKEKTADHLW